MNMFIKRMLLAGLVLTAVVAPVQEAKAGVWDVVSACHDLFIDGGVERGRSIGDYVGGMVGGIATFCVECFVLGVLLDHAIKAAKTVKNGKTNTDMPMLFH